MGVPDSMSASEADHPAGGARTRFDPWTGYLLYGLRVCRTARQTSILQDGVRFLGRLLLDVVQLYGKARCTMSNRNFNEQSFFSRR